MINIKTKFFYLVILILKETKSNDVTTANINKPAIEPEVNNHPNWNYIEAGPYEWPHMFESCKGNAQSPINIVPSHAKFDKNLKPFDLKYYDLLYDFKVFNGANSVLMMPISRKDTICPYLNGSNFNETFKLLQFHFHWGYSNNQGSEHTLDNRRFPLELHMVHNSSKGQLTVLGFFFENLNIKISKENNTMLDPIINILTSIADQPESDRILHQYKIENMIGNQDELNSNGYFRYFGSLTIPPCSENVIWNIFEKKIPISAEQMNTFRIKYMKQTFRFVQELKGRVVFSSRCQTENIQDECNGKVTGNMSSVMTPFKEENSSEEDSIEIKI